MNVAQYMVVGMIRVYQVTLSPLLRVVSGGAAGCRFEPSCSAYALEAVRRHGAFKGGRLALCRIARCHPWGEAGYDPVPGTENGVTQRRDDAKGNPSPRPSPQGEGMKPSHCSHSPWLSHEARRRHAGAR